MTACSAFSLVFPLDHFFFFPLAPVLAGLAGALKLWWEKHAENQVKKIIHKFSTRVHYNFAFENDGLILVDWIKMRGLKDLPF